MTPPARSVLDQAASESIAEVQARLRAMIENGALGPDGRLPPEREMCQMTRAGRRTVRRALDVLEAEGLIWRRQGKGTFAGLPPDPTQVLAAEIVGETTILEVMEARLCIEPALAAMCAARALPADIARMRNLAARTLSAADTVSFELWDGALHKMIARTADNKPLLTAFSMIDEIRGNENWRGLRSKARSVETLQVSDSEHHAIIDRIEAGDAAGAEAAMRAHLTTLARNLQRIIGTHFPEEAPT
ncbi:MAG: FCD domain-containing protein [Pseudotabrizicola sp.]|uniref:FadR/GntR family transcriptional regulator n=1 Tax=Pseudotabrizicola sp. TaxID=2939647 RepID=UPI0027271864|nr:FCD domain-containing protein [Pseudotabrizicola sp.]MDO9641078.1 FCD domain-containing protein [Pseudotabrizicola sp.]